MAGFKTNDEHLMKKMILTVLTENQAGGKYAAEHGLSYLIYTGDKPVLFDTGHSDLFLRNAYSMGIDIQKTVEKVVLSHGHWDHGDGLRYLSNKKLFCHPEVFMKRYRKTDNSFIGLNQSKKEINLNFEVCASKDPRKISETITFLGEIPRLNDFESQTTGFIDENGNPDFIPDDSAIAIHTDDELVIVTGCSHSGICNIIEYAMKVTGLKKIKAVIGGFHLKSDNQQTKKTIEYLKALRIDSVYPSHCTEFPALVAMNKSFRIGPLKTGTHLKI